MAQAATDRELLDRLVREHLPALLRLATRLTGDLHTAEEVVQDALARIAKSWNEFRSAATFQTWATRIVINVFRDRLRRTRRRFDHESTNRLADETDYAEQLADRRHDEPPRVLLDAELAETVAVHVSSLPARQREVFILIVYENLTPPAAAELLETTVANIHSTLYAARQTLARRLADYMSPAELEPRTADLDQAPQAMHEDQASPPNDAALDALLAAARWREHDAAQLARLSAAWEQSFAHTEAQPAEVEPVRSNVGRRTFIARWQFVAATLLLCAASAWAMLRNRAAPPEVVSPAPLPTRQSQSPEIKPLIAIRSPAPIVVRPPSAIETALVRAWQSREKLEAFKSDELVESAIDAVRDERFGEARQFVRRMTVRRAYYEQRLLDNARYFDGPRRSAALALLGEIGNPRILPDLVPLVEYDRSAPQVAACVIEIVDAPRVAYLARAARNSATRRALLRVLLVSDQMAAHETFLGCVLQSALRGDCLQVAQQSPSLPESYLFRQLQSTQSPRRLAAAVLLAQSRNPQSIDRMISLVRRGVAADAAVVALIGNSQPQARSFIDQLRAAPRLVATVNTAANQWRQFVTLPDAAL